MNKFEKALMLINERQNKDIYFSKYLKIKDRESSKVIPFVINSSQAKLKDIIDEWDKGTKKQTLFVVILKARRQGFSTYVEGDFFVRIKHEKGKTAMVISYDEESAKTVNKMTNTFYEHLPHDAKPMRRPSRGRGLILENPKFDFSLPIDENTNNPGLQSEFLIETAGNPNAGSGYNINYLHISELSKFSGDIEVTMTSLLQAVPNEDSIVIIESTAKGYNYFKDVWDDANAYDYVDGNRVKRNDFIPLFIPWFEDKKSTMKYDFFKLTNFDHETWGNELELKELFNLTYDQLTWRRWCIKNKCHLSLDNFHQEYPSTPEESFISTGSPIFDNRKIEARIEKLRNFFKITKYRTGRFEYELNVDKSVNDETIKFVDDVNGIIRIYEEPTAGHPYAIGGDTSGEGSDFFAAHVINNSNGRQVAVYHCVVNSDLFAYQMYCLGRYYNDALIAIEMNFDPHPIKVLQELMYPMIYRRESVDRIQEDIQEKYGFRTDRFTRPIIINNLISIVRDSIEFLYDIETLQEMLTFAKDKSGKPSALPGKHDDYVMSLAITYYCRRQMYSDIPVEEQYKDPKDNWKHEYSEKKSEGFNWL